MHVMSDLPPNLNGPSGFRPSNNLEIAHVLFTDIVGYSKLPMDKQGQLLMSLQNAVRETPEFIRAEASGELICLPTGDGMALVFFRDPESPVRCALELSRGLKTYPEIRLRMGIHSGPVYRVADINANRNVAGGGINMAQRVMDCCDAGHILVSEEVAKVLGQLSNWNGCLKDLGEAEVKHSVRIHLFNLFTDDAGNSTVPGRLRAAALSDKRPAATRRPILLAIGFLMAALIVCGVVGLFYAGSGHRLSRASGKSSGPVTIARLTNNGNSKRAAVSPDGKYVAYVVEDADRQSLRIRQMLTSSDVEVVPPLDAVYSDLYFSPEGDYVYFTRSPISTGKNWFDSLIGENSATFYRVSTLGGSPRELVDRLGVPAVLSPDGRRLCFIDINSRLMLVNVDGTQLRDFMTSDQPVFGLAWSKGSEIALSTPGGISTVSFPSVMGAQLGIDLDGTRQRVLSRMLVFGVGDASWLSDGSSLIVSANGRNAGAPSQLWRVKYPEGDVDGLTNDFNDYQGVSVTLDSKSLVTIERQNVYSTWVIRDRDEGEGRRISIAAGDEGALRDLAWVPDGRLLYVFSSDGHTNIGIMNADGSNRKALTMDDANAWMPSASLDGKSIAFVSDKGGSQRIWKMGIDGGNSTPVTNGAFDSQPSMSPDGKWILYSDNEGIWKAPLNGGPAIFVSKGYWFEPSEVSARVALSPDGRMIFSNSLSENYTLDVSIFDFERGTLIQSFPKPGQGVAWSPEGHALTYVRTQNGISNIWSQSLTGERPKQLTHFSSDRIFSYAWSQDGKRLAVARGTETSDVVFVTNFR
jgi:Tol biopolymer transport system component/class 3 adenylate cyclase